MAKTYITESKNIDEGSPISIGPRPTQRRPWFKLGGQDHPFVSVDAGYPRATDSASSSESDLTVPNKAHNVWETQDAHDIYAPIAGYEGAHRFDPNFKWEPEEEKALIRKVSRPFDRHLLQLLIETARLAYRTTSMHYVLRSSIGPWQYRTSPCRHHVE